MPKSKSERDAITRRVSEIEFDPTRCKTQNVAHCNLCGETRRCVFSWTDRYEYAVPFNVCMNCGLGYLSPRLTADEYSEFYGKHYRPLVSAYHGRLIDAETVQTEQADYTRQLVNFVHPIIGTHPVNRLIDLGGSTGVVAGGLARALGCSALVLDPSAEELKRASALGLETVCCLLEDYEPQHSGKADLAILCQTVDHLLDIKTALGKIHDLLNDGGWFYVDFVDVMAVARREQRLSGAIKIDHPYYLTRQTMEAYLDVSGFDVHTMTVLPDGHHIGYLCRKSSPKSLNKREKMDTEWIFREFRNLQVNL